MAVAASVRHLVSQHARRLVQWAIRAVRIRINNFMKIWGGV